MLPFLRHRPIIIHQRQRKGGGLSSLAISSPQIRDNIHKTAPANRDEGLVIAPMANPMMPVQAPPT